MNADKKEIEILCPNKKCPKCKRFIAFFEKIIKENKTDAEIIIITGLKELLQYKTWILPTSYINGKKVSRGYLPKNEEVLKFLI